MYGFIFNLDVVQFTVKKGVTVRFLDSITNVLGLSGILYDGGDTYLSRMGAAVDFLYVHCDILARGLVGDTMAPLLRTIPVAGRENYYVKK